MNDTADHVLETRFLMVLEACVDVRVQLSGNQIPLKILCDGWMFRSLAGEGDTMADLQCLFHGMAKTLCRL